MEWTAAAATLIFQNQGFDRLSEFPKIRDAIIVFTDGCGGLVDLKLYRDYEWRSACPGFDSTIHSPPNLTVCSSLKVFFSLVL